MTTEETYTSADVLARIDAIIAASHVTAKWEPCELVNISGTNISFVGQMVNSGFAIIWGRETPNLDVREAVTVSFTQLDTGDQPVYPGLVDISWQLLENDGDLSNCWTVTIEAAENLSDEDREELSEELSEIAFGIDETFGLGNTYEVNEEKFLKAVEVVLDWLGS